MKNTVCCFIVIFCSILFESDCLIAQQKLPTYAIRTQYQIDGIRDTLGPKAGGVVLPGSTVIRDSVLFHYTNKGQLEREQIFRTQIVPPYIYYPDSSYYYRQHRYDGQGRKISVRHFDISSNRNSLDYGTHNLMRIDSMAYDSHGNQLFIRRYEPYDFDRGNLTMVVKDYKFEKDGTTYDNLGRLTSEYRYTWSDGKRNLGNLFPEYPYFVYSYQGTTKKLRARRFKTQDGTQFVIAKDTLFTYDSKERLTNAN